MADVINTKLAMTSRFFILKKGDIRVIKLGPSPPMFGEKPREIKHASQPNHGVKRFEIASAMASLTCSTVCVASITTIRLGSAALIAR